MNYRKDDIVQWAYTPEELKRRNDGNNNGTTYWCCSRIAVFNGERFVDTYWGSGSDNKSFSLSCLGKTHEVREYVGNFDELEKCGYSNMDHLTPYYNRDDIVNLNHPNDTRGNLYLRKGAKKDIEVIRKSLERKKEDLEYKLKYAQIDLDKTITLIQNLSEDNLDSIYI